MREAGRISLQTAHGPYISMNRAGYIYGNRQSPGKGETFRVIRAGEMITLVSALGVSVAPDLKKRAAMGDEEQARAARIYRPDAELDHGLLSPAYPL